MPKSPKIRLILAMVLWGMLGLFIRGIHLSAEQIAMVRSILGSATLGCIMLFLHPAPRCDIIRRNLFPLTVSSACLCANWVLLFHAYRNATIPVATLCYYISPTIITLLSPLLVKERLTPRKAICIAASLLGMVLVSGILETGLEGSGITGVAFGLAAACGYAGVVFTNKHLNGLTAYESTFAQLIIASFLMTAYVLMTGSAPSCPPLGQCLMLAFVGVVLTGVTFVLFFGALSELPAQTTAAYSYLDPVTAIILATVFLNEPLGITGFLGGVLILGSTYLADRTA